MCLLPYLAATAEPPRAAIALRCLIVIRRKPRGSFAVASVAPFWGGALTAALADVAGLRGLRAGLGAGLAAVLTGAALILARFVSFMVFVLGSCLFVFGYNAAY
jgi:hypothetical protein